jgi:excisionase family DNA binding protein
MQGAMKAMTEERTDRWLTVEEVAGELKVGPETVRRWIRAGALSVLDLGSRSGGYRIRQADFDAFIARRYRAARQEGEQR